MPVHSGDDLQYVFLVHLDAFLLAGGAPFAQNGLKLLLGVLFLVAHRGGAFEILVLDRALLAGLDFFDVSFERLDLGRPGHGADTRAGTRLIHNVNRLVRQITVGDIAVRELYGRFNGLVREFRLL